MWNNLKRKIMRQLLLAFMLILAFADTKSQATIGSGIAPEQAALLQLKTQEATTSGGATTGIGGGGLLLPRVMLTDRNTLEPFIEKDNSGNEEYIKTKKRYTGMIVYNLTELTGLKLGVCVWDGDKWNNMYDTEALNSTGGWMLEGNPLTGNENYFIGTTDNQKISFRTNNLERMHITGGGNVGLKTEDIPEQTLEVNGQTTLNDILTLKNLEKAPYEVAQLVVDKDDRVCEVISSTGNITGINSLTYIFSNLQTGDWVGSFNTKIPTDEYTLVVVGYSFLPNINYPTDGLSVGTVNKDYPGTYVPMEVYATMNQRGTQSDYWLLTADYVGGSIYMRENKYPSGTWVIHCHIINNSLVNNLKNQSFDLNGNIRGSATQLPEGL